MLDGQHRLRACVETGISFETVLVTGLPDAVFTTLDQGSKRTLAQMLALGKVKNYTKCAGIVHREFGYLKTGKPIVSGSSTPSKKIMIDFISANKEIELSAEIVASTRLIQKLVPPTLIGWFVFQALKKKKTSKMPWNLLLELTQVAGW